jgi:photosystem II stability/assembly factor-like uncharacterized protein
MLRTSLRTVAAVAILAVAVTACGGADPAAQPAGPGGGTAPGGDPGTGHIHGLGIDPADGTLYIAAHFGIFKVVSGARVERVAGRYQDTMGFTITGPRKFLASGHPPTDNPGPPHLGLIQSTDAGLTWSEISETGKADFHALQPVGKTLYAYDSQTGRVRRSGDGGRTWVIGAKLRVIDLAASADQPDRVYATTPQGVWVSGDSGKTFSPVASAPPLTHLDAPAIGVLTGVGVDGQLHTSPDGGTTWQRLGRLPAAPVTAFTAVDDQRLLAATEHGSVYESRNGGRAFAVAYQQTRG